MNTQFYCKNKGRRRALKEQNSLNGIDYLEVGSADQKTLEVYFIHNLPGETNPVPPSPAPAFTKENLVIEGGVRIKNIKVKTVESLDNVLKITVDETGDFSTYNLRIVVSQTNLATPDGFDPQLSEVDFSFKVTCPTEFDCKTVIKCPTDKLTEPAINYLAKDYASFRRLMLDRLSIIMPDWEERNAADVQIALVELLAYAGDYLSYYQDAVATEAYLGTARKRVSIRRHARLLDYYVHDGCNSRVWVSMEVEKGSSADGMTIPVGTTLLTRGSEDQTMVKIENIGKALSENPQVFETMHDLTLQNSHNQISFYTWSDSECCLPRGSTRATLLNNPTLFLEAGDVLIFEEVISPTTGTAADADSAHRHAVRLKQVQDTVDPLSSAKVLQIEWHEADALPFPLCITARIIGPDGTPEMKEVSVVRGNVVLADCGRTITGESLLPSEVPEQSDYRPQLPRIDICFGVPYEDEKTRQSAAISALKQTPQKALPHVSLKFKNEKWITRYDLLNSARFANEFVVEMERDGRGYLRFGDNILGKKPSPGSTFALTYRVGNGSAGNVGAETITRIVTNSTGIEQIRNPMSARGGTNPETMEQVRQFAPQAFRTQQRAVTEADYAEVMQRHPEVQQAVARFRWTGSWYTVFVIIDRKGGLEVETDAVFKNQIRAYLERYRIAGFDVEIKGPVFVPLDICLLVCVKPGYFRSNVKESLLTVFSRYDLVNGSQGFFHPDNFTFGQPVYLSQIYQTTMKVAGVASVEVERFQRWGYLPAREIEDGFLKPAALEVIRLHNDPNFPENGKINFIMRGGL